MSVSNLNHDDGHKQLVLNIVEQGLLIYPNCLNECNSAAAHVDDDTYNEVISNIFFDLANASEVLYRIRHLDDIHKIDKNSTDQYLVFQQDMGACSRHTGGIIWETSYLLLEYLLELHRNGGLETPSLGRTCELGAGVGFLGQCLVAERCSCTPVLILSETADVVTNLNKNLIRNRSVLEHNEKCTLCVAALDWTCYKDDIEKSAGAIQPHSIDTLLSTDVIFSTLLVAPLLQTAAYLSHNQTIWYLCVQVRCAAAHELFLELASSYGFCVNDISNECYHSMSQCKWGKTLDCFLFRITRVAKA